MSELSFLTGLLREPKLSKPIRDKILDRLEAIDSEALQPGYRTQGTSIGQTPSLQQSGPQQAPSMLAIMARNPDLVHTETEKTPALPAPEPVTQIAQTPAAAAALASRRQAIQESLSGKIDKASGRPRKF